MKYTPGVVHKVSRENSVADRILTHQVSACKDGSSLFLESLYSWTVAPAIPFSEQVPYPIRSMDRPVCTTEIVERNLSAHEHISEV